MSTSGWRVHANRVIVKIIMDNPKMEEKPLRKLISDAYPFGQRAMHPYKIWCSEVANCLWSLRKIGKKPTKAQLEEKTLFNQVELFT